MTFFYYLCTTFEFMNKSVDSLTQKRDDELTSVFLRMLGDGRLAKDVMSSAASMPASRFWVEPENALRHIRWRLKGTWGDKGNENPMIVKKIDAIIERCDGCFSIEKVTEVVEGPAPSFFLTGGTAKNIIYATLRKRRMKHG